MSPTETEKPAAVPAPPRSKHAGTPLGKTRRGFRFWLTILVLLLMAGGAAAAVYRFRHTKAADDVPVTQAKLGDFLVVVRCRGTLQARHSAGFYTPMVPGLRIAWMAQAGETINEGEPIIRFDSSQAQQQLMQKQAQLQQAQASLDQWIAQAKITAEQDKSDLADAQFNVQTAKMGITLALSKGKLESEKAGIDERLAEQKLKVTEASVDLHRVSDQAKMASLTRVRDQAKADVDITNARIAQMELKAPGSGLLIFNMNYQGVMNSSDAKPYKIGDNVYSGMDLGEIPDMNTIELEGKIEETDRGRISKSQDVLVKIDALPELSLQAKMGDISPLAEISFNEYPPTRSFRGSAQILHPDKRLRPGMNGGMDIVTKRIPNALSIPSRALFTKNGNPVVYVASGGDYRAVEVKVEARNPDEVAISGIPAGSTVTLVDPEKRGPKK